MSLSGLHRVVVTGAGILTAQGAGWDANAEGFFAGRSCGAQISRFDPSGLGTQCAAEVDLGAYNHAPAASRTIQMLEAVIDEAVTASGMDPKEAELILALPPVQLEWSERIALADTVPSTSRSTAGLLTSLGPDVELAVQISPGRIAHHLAQRYQTRSNPIATTTACSSGSTALIIGCERMDMGLTHAVIVAGADASLSPEMLSRFGKLGALTTLNDRPAEASRPFSQSRDGFLPGEGAAAVVLERLDGAERRGALPLGAVSGKAELCDGYHRVRQQPDGGPIAEVMTAALADAGLTACDVSLIKAHATATKENDFVEYLGSKRVFGKHLPVIPVTGLKSMIGHTLTASGLVEAVAVLQMLAAQQIMPTINLSDPDPVIGFNVATKARECSLLTHVVCNSFGFGGQNTCLVLSRLPG